MDTRRVTRVYRLTPEGLAAKRAAMNRPEVREKHRAAWNRPEVREKHRAAMNRPEVREKHRAAATAAWKNPDTVRRRAETLARRANQLAGFPRMEIGG